MSVFTFSDGYAISTDGVTASDGPEFNGNIIVVDNTHFRINYGGGDFDDFYGNFTYTNGKPTGGTYTRTTETLGTTVLYDFSGLNIGIADHRSWIATNNTEALLNGLLGGDDTATLSNLNDVVRVRAGNDVITGRGGADLIDGGAGFDTAVYSGRYQDYRLTNNSDGSIRVADLRAGMPDGSDTLVSIESLRFSDKTVSTVAPAATAPVTVAYTNILRGGTSGADAAAINDLSTLPQAQAVAQIIVLAGATTSVATLAYQFFTGKIPGSPGYDFLVSATGPNANNLNSTYYQNFNLENRYINFAVNLGRVGEGSAAFNAAYNGKTLFDATKAAYQTIFGGAPTDAKVHLLIDSRVDYFAAYGGDGANGIGTKAAMVGWLMAEAIKADIGMFAKSNDAFLADLSDGATYSVDLIGTYGNASFVVSG